MAATTTTITTLSGKNEIRGSLIIHHDTDEEIDTIDVASSTLRIAFPAARQRVQDRRGANEQRETTTRTAAQQAWRYRRCTGAPPIGCVAISSNVAPIAR